MSLSSFKEVEKVFSPFPSASEVIGAERTPAGGQVLIKSTNLTNQLAASPVLTCSGGLTVCCTNCHCGLDTSRKVLVRSRTSGRTVPGSDSASAGDAAAGGEGQAGTWRAWTENSERNVSALQPTGCGSQSCHPGELPLGRPVCTRCAGRGALPVSCNSVIPVHTHSCLVHEQWELLTKCKQKQNPGIRTHN